MKPETIISEKGLVGWRSLEVVKPYFLVSGGGSMIWIPNERAEAECTRFGDQHPDVPAPASNCTCGIYSMKTLEDFDRSYYCKCKCWVELYIWGKIQEASEGYRAQYAYPKQIFLIAELAHMAPILQGAYGVPVTIAPPRIQLEPGENPQLRIINKYFTAKPPAPKDFMKYHAGYKRFYELAAEMGVDTSYDDSCRSGMGRSVKIYCNQIKTDEQMLALMKCADKVILGSTRSGRGGRRCHPARPYRFHFYITEKFQQHERYERNGD